MYCAAPRAPHSLSPAQHWKLRELGRYPFIFHVSSCPKYVSHTSKCMTCRRRSLWARGKFQSGHDNKLKYKDFTALCHPVKPLQTTQRPSEYSLGMQHFQAFTSHSPLSLLWSHQLEWKLLFNGGLIPFVLYTVKSALRAKHITRLAWVYLFKFHVWPPLEWNKKIKGLENVKTTHFKEEANYLIKFS